jgi:hypothetical protein
MIRIFRRGSEIGTRVVAFGPCSSLLEKDKEGPEIEQFYVNSRFEMGTMILI